MLKCSIIKQIVYKALNKNFCQVNSATPKMFCIAGRPTSRKTIYFNKLCSFTGRIPYGYIYLSVLLHGKLCCKLDL